MGDVTELQDVYGLEAALELTYDTVFELTEETDALKQRLDRFVPLPAQRPGVYQLARPRSQKLPNLAALNAEFERANSSPLRNCVLAVRRARRRYPRFTFDAFPAF